MRQDDFGFPPRIDFEPNSGFKRRPIRFLPIVVIVLAVGLATGFAYLVESNDNWFGDLSRRMPMFAKEPPQRISARIAASLRMQDYDRALKLCDRLIEQHPSFATDAYTIKGIILSQLDRNEEAIKAYNEVIKGDPSSAIAYNNRAYARAIARVDLNEAEKDIEKAISIAGNVPEYVDTRGYLHYLFGRFDKALADFDEVIEARKDDRSDNLGEIYFHRGLVHRAMGNAQKAEADFNAARGFGFRFDSFPEPVVKPENSL